MENFWEIHGWNYRNIFWYYYAKSERRYIKGTPRNGSKRKPEGMTEHQF